MSDFEGKVVIITGAGGGLGRCHALAFAERGARVVVNDLGGTVDGSGEGDAADRVVEEILANGGTAIANKSSVANVKGAAKIVQDAVDTFGTVDILVNNAGILRDKSFKKMTVQDFELVVQVHLIGTAYVTHAAWPIMYDKGFGRVVFTSSGSGLFGNFGQANYAAAKMGMVGLMNVLALEGASHDVRVNCLAPAAVTRMTASLPGRPPVDPENPPQEMAPELVTPAVLYMCAENAPTGKIVQAQGGRFSIAGVYQNRGIDQGEQASLERIVDQEDKLLDMSGAADGALIRRRQRGG